MKGTKASVRERMSNFKCSIKNIATMLIERELERLRIWWKYRFDFRMIFALGSVESLLVRNLVLAEQSPREQSGSEQRDRLI